MKSKLRKITINLPPKPKGTSFASDNFPFRDNVRPNMPTSGETLDFKYLINEKYQKETGCWLTVLRVFKDGLKNTPLEIKFESKDGYTIGNMLTSGTMINNEEFNLHKPSIIRKIIEEAIHRKWNWEESKLEIPDGLQFLTNIGYNTETLKTISSTQK